MESHRPHTDHVRGPVDVRPAGAPRTMELPALSPLVADVLAVALEHLGLVTLPPRRPDLVGVVLEEAGLIEQPHLLYVSDDLEDWQPCLLTLRLAPSLDPAELPVEPGTRLFTVAPA